MRILPSAHNRRYVIGFVGAGLGVVLFASAAFACTSYRGTMTVTANQHTAGEVVSTGDCGAHTTWGPAVGVLNVAAGQAAGAATVDVAIGTSPTPCSPVWGSGTNQLPDTVTDASGKVYPLPYELTFVNGPSYGPTHGYFIDPADPPIGWNCMTGNTLALPKVYVASIGTLSGGVGGKNNVALPANLTADAIGTQSSLCVGSSKVTKGNGATVVDAGWQGNSVPIMVAVI